MKKSLLCFLIAGISLLMVSCNNDDPELPDNLINFEAAELGFDSDQLSRTITLQLSRAADADVDVQLTLASTGVTYGTEYTTTPAAADNTVLLTVPSGSNTVSFTVDKAEDVFLSGEETVLFTIATVEDPVLTGTTTELLLKFSAIVSSGSEITLNGGEGGSSAVNSVFVDFSNNTQTSVARASWDLGFYNGDDFRVILNNTTSASAVALTKNDLSQVTAQDTVGLNLTISVTPEALALVDDVTGDLTKTVIAGVSATDGDNVVYIVNRGTGGGIAPRPWKKIRILRDGTNGYILQYANIKETTYTSLTIPKNEEYNFSFVSFDNGLVSVEPQKDRWDIEWTGTVYKTTNEGSDVPYYFADQVYINRLAGVTAAEVLTSTVSYDNFNASHISSLSFSDERSVIGANWRETGGPGGGPAGVKTDRFYVVKDLRGNVYKLKFISFTSQDGGTRGYPKIAYGLVQESSE
jgi:hypothetical protein